jgi:hypothetical protein
MRHVPPKRRLTFNGLHGVISHKIELFITTAVRTSNPIGHGKLKTDNRNFLSPKVKMIVLFHSL